MGVFIADGDARLYMASTALQDIFGIPPRQMIGLRCGPAFGCAKASEHPMGCGFGTHCRMCNIRRTIVEAYERNESVLQREAEIKVGPGEDARIRHLCLSASPVELGGNKRVLVFLEDVSNRKASEIREKELESQLYQAQKMESVGRLAGGVAHDFNNLLTVILGYVDILINDLQEGHPHFGMLQSIRQSSLRARNLTRQLLAFSRKQVLEMEKVELNSIIFNFEKLLRRVIGEDIEVRILPSERPLVIKADTAQVEQVLMNLAVNARDAMPKGGSLIMETQAVYLDRQYAEKKPGVVPGKYAMLSISDTGCGMDRATLARVFEPFFTTKSKDRGTGLGLATSYGIIKQHGGNIWVYSELGVGTTFKIYLPLVNGETETKETETCEEQVPPGRATILVVEDDASVRELAASILTKGGYTVMTASCLSQALETLEDYSGSLDLLLTDVIMPETDGPQVYSRIASHYPEVKVLYMSGYTDDILTRRGLKKTVHFIQKPFTYAQLLNAVSKTLEEK